MPVTVHPPDADDFPTDFSVDDFMGTWYVTHSTLPLWKNKKDVTITYTPAASNKGSPQHPVFDDLVEYRSQNSSSTKPRSRVEGVDTYIPSYSSSSPPTRYKWRGRGWLMIASSRWQILGYSRLSENKIAGPSTREGEEQTGATSPSQDRDVEWALTYFEKTLFTPAGMDIYARTPEGLPDTLVQEIITQAKAVGGDITPLAEKFFEVQRSQR
ncbi:hypothetical protein PUNSTDRAFT_119089 [Punctularia strigosozonata HHB-11173 SS5]|uniref:uncharacterized protein n=1 Tax=Punctularia strigosozonata (strain HHB-11173) TaxID=741275 RepID=UPI00044177B2|nr:uncharacterized protein PUNSTDRAFT_119089 [Punctularia strigosozonata HHB-11173 SS5]EIN11874.1 hypothetical protein PUNSTDRAFT_119089 [Punctularia strigosozonata HHB-11173 SS5]